MFRVTFSDAKMLRAFLGINDITYIDLRLTGKKCFLITNSNEIFTMLEVPAYLSTNQEDVKFRVHKKLFMFLDSGDSIEFTLESHGISAVILNSYGSVNFSSHFDLQVVADSAYSDKVSILENLKGDTQQIDGSKLFKIFKIAKLNGGLINVADGVASIMMLNGIRVYKSVETNQRFSFTSYAYECLMKCSNIFINQGDYLIAALSGFYVMARKARLGDNSEYALVSGKQFGSKYIAEINLGGLLLFLNKTKVRLDTITLDIQQCCCKVTYSDMEFTIPVTFSGAQLAPGATITTVELQTNLITTVLSTFGSNVFTIKVKKNFVQFEIDDYIVVV